MPSLKIIAERAAHSLGAAHLLRLKNRSHPRILMYHRFPGRPDDLQARLTAQCEHIRRHYHPVTLDEIANASLDHRPLPDNSIAITIDDGYRDFQLAFPIFQRFGLPVTLYVVSGFAAGALWFWPDQLLYILENTSRREIEIPTQGHLIGSNSSDSFPLLCREMIAMNDRDRQSFLSTLPEILDVEIPKLPPDRFAPLSWDDLRALASEGLDVGAHTIHHPILSKLATEAELQNEIAGSKGQIEAATGAAVKHFCYPNGKFVDVNDAAVAIAQAAGFRTAVLAEPGMVRPPVSLYRLKRVAVDPDYPPLYFERCLAGYRL